MEEKRYSVCGCGCDCKSVESQKQIGIDFLYLDLTTCDRCQETEGNVDAAIALLQPVLQEMGYELRLNKVEMVSEELARSYQFLSSPTIRVNGRDISLEVKENACSCCSDISGNDVDCRVFLYEGKEYEAPPKAMIIRSILEEILLGTKEAAKQNDYQLPENLKQFYDGKSSKADCGCGCGGSC